jgi:hypothetical protein
MYPGRAHPLVTRTITSIRTGRVSAAKGKTRSLLMTYTVEAGALLRSVIALQLFPDGSVKQQNDCLALPGKAIRPTGLWQKHFTGWAEDAIAAASHHASNVADRLCAAAARKYNDRVGRDIAAAHAWLARRANELCGPALAVTRDLFAPEPEQLDWRSDQAPEHRLANLAADPSIPIPHRRDAAEAVTRFHALTAMSRSFPPRIVRPLGMLMLLP